MKKVNWRAGIIIAVTLALIFVITRFYMTNFYTPEWSARHIFWSIALIVIISAVLNKIRFSITAFLGYLLGMVGGELFGGFQKHIPPQYLHYGWLIHILVFAVFCIFGIWFQCKDSKQQNTSSQ